MNKEELKKKLTPEQFHITQEAGTEPAFVGKYVENYDNGMYHCIVCNYPLFNSNTKYNSNSGWPAFTDPEIVENIETKEDFSDGMNRIEVLCKNCGAHLGHVFPDGPGVSGLRYCINSCSLDFNKKPK